MKRISYLGLAIALLCSGYAFAGEEDARFKAEVLEGLDIVSARLNADIVPDSAPGALGEEVYMVEGAVNNTNTRMFIPTTMYVRMGAGYGLPFATDKAEFKVDSVGDMTLKTKDSWSTQIGLGLNFSSFVRGELDFQAATFNFDFDIEKVKLSANYQSAGAMLYFDFARRYIQTGDITYRRRFVPFMGIGAGVGQYAFETDYGANGFFFAAPRAALGFNVMLTDLIGIDVMYQYQMMLGNGFGWGTNLDSVNNISNIMVSVRANF